MKKKILLLLIIFVILIGMFNLYKSMPASTSFEGEIYGVKNDAIQFFSDKTHYDTEEDIREVDQEIFDEVFSIIDNAENYILIDMFLYNDFQGKEKEKTRALSQELTDNLVSKKQSNPDMDIVFITDPINQIYGDFNPQNLDSLEKAGIEVVITDLTKLRDSNPTYSAIWRSILKHLPLGFIKVPNPFVHDSDKIGLDSFLTLLNFKANHRKVIIADYLDQNGQLKMTALVTSANPHDGSSAHHNVSVKIDDFIWQDILKTEKAVADFSKQEISLPNGEYKNEKGEVLVQLLTEKKIRDSIIDSIDQTKEGDSIKMVMFYLSDRGIVKSFKKAYERGVDIEIILDPNKDAFGRTKNGVPNVVVAREFKKLNQDFKIRWCDTHGEQCHSKMVLVKKGDNTDMFIGSANLTRRNIDNYNLETDFKISGHYNKTKAINDAYEYFERLWNNDPHEYTTNYNSYKDESFLKLIQYQIMERTGLSSF